MEDVVETVLEVARIGADAVPAKWQWPAIWVTVAGVISFWAWYFFG